MIAYVVKDFICPDIRSQADAEIIRESLENAPEIDECTIDVATRTVSIRYAESMNTGDLYKRLADSGFPPES